MHLLPTPRSEGGEGIMYILESFILSVLASVVAGKADYMNAWGNPLHRSESAEKEKPAGP